MGSFLAILFCFTNRYNCIYAKCLCLTCTIRNIYGTPVKKVYMPTLPGKFTGYSQYPRPLNVRKLFSLAPRVPTPPKPASPPVLRSKLFATSEIRSRLTDSLKPLVPIFTALHTERDLAKFITEKKRTLLSSAVDIARPVANANRSNAPSNSELFLKERKQWIERNPKKAELARVRDERDRMQLERKRKDKYPSYFSGVAGEDVLSQSHTMASST
jgi:hypothetical protein